MKEVTYEDWQKNPTPRMMWVWDNESSKKKLKVLYILSEEEYVTRFRVIALANGDSCAIRRYAHCAEIEIEKQRRMTNKELARWIREKPTREWKYKNGTSVYGYYVYEEKCENEEVLNNILIREDDGEWREPLVEVGELQMKKKQRGEE